MAAQAEADVLGTEMERVRTTIPVLFDREGTFFAAIQKRGDVEVVSARQMRIPQELRPGGKFGYWNPDGGDLGRGGASKYDKAVISVQHLRFAVEWTTLAQWVTDDKKKAVINTFQRNLASAMSEFRRHLDAQSVGAGDGVVGTVETVTAAATDTYLLDSSFGAKLVRFGQDINIYSSDLLTNRTVGAEKTITYHSIADRTIKALTTAGVVAGDKIVVSGLSATPPVGIKGVLYHHSNASTGTWLGYDRSTTPEIRANRVNAGSSSFSLPLARLAVNKAADRVGEDNVGELQAWMHACQVDSYEQLGQLVTMITQTGESKGLDRYFGGAFTMAGCPVKKSYNWHKQRIDFVSMKYWGRGETKPIGYYEVDGRKIWEVRSSDGGVNSSNLFYLVSSFDLFVTNPAGCSYIDTLTIPTGY